jgi:hypothetical protein
VGHFLLSRGYTTLLARSNTIGDAPMEDALVAGRDPPWRASDMYKQMVESNFFIRGPATINRG